MLKEEIVDGFSPDKGEDDEGEDANTWEKISSTLYSIFRRHKYLFTLFACVIGISIPVAIFYTVDLRHSRPNYGRCRINETYRMQVGINTLGTGLADVDSCVANFGCWDSNETLPHKCYHSIPSTYQYFYKNVEASSDMVKATLKPATGLSNLLNETLFYFYWEAKDVLSLELHPAKSMMPPSDPETFPWANSVYEDYNISPAPGAQMVTPDDFFYVAVKRVNGSDIFDTRYAPLGIAPDRLMIGTSLPSRYFHGLKGGEGFLNFGDETVDGLIGFGKNELPFYMVYHNDSTCHGVLMETEKPFVAQFIKGPAVHFEFQGDFTRSSIAVKLFLGPKPSDVLQQLREYLITKNEGLLRASPSTISSLGVHLCRRSVNADETLKHLKALNDKNIPYDSDCISENLRMPFEINKAEFSEPKLEEICNVLAQDHREIMLTQKLHRVPNETRANETFIVEYFRRNYTLYQGAINREAMNYFSVFSSAGREFIMEEVRKLPDICANVAVTGIALVDNFPKTDSLNLTNAGTRIEAEFASSNTWDLLSPKAIHRNVSGSGLEVYHLDVVNAYGQESMKLVSEVLPAGMRISTASQWTDSSVYGSFRGIQVPFTWAGFRDALGHYLRYFMFNPTSGIPICGSNANQGKYNVSDDLLCMRWFQAALLLPHVHHTLPRWIYNETEVERAAGFNGIYEQHLKDSIMERYTLLPYYSTLLSQYESNDTSYSSEPPITPISYQFPDERDNFYILDQFMIGIGLMAAPMVEKGTMRSVYFPPGTWYTFRGERISSNRKRGESKFVVALANYTPLFLREGFIVPVLERPASTVLTAREAVLQGSYSVLAPYPVFEDTVTNTVGALRISDDDFSLAVDFSMTRENLMFNVTCNNGGGSAVVMSSAKIFGFPAPYPRSFTLELETDSVIEIPVENIRINEETNILIIEHRTTWCAAGEERAMSGLFSWTL